MKSYRDNGGGGGGGGGFGARSKTVYDDVFGGPPKFGATTLPPRLEDYTEIFQGFHASRGSSIPVLDLPPPSDESGDVWFDVQASKLDYSEVFGGFNGLDFAVSYEELFGGSKAGDDDSSDDVWTPAQSESLSDESDPYAFLEMSQHVSAADPDQSFVTKKRFNLSQNKAYLEAEKDVSGGVTNDSRFHDVPGSTLVNDKVLPNETESEQLSSLSNNDNVASKDFGGFTEGKRLEKSFSQPLDSGFGSERYGSDMNHLLGNHKADSVGNRPLSVSDLSLKTQPSQLPPPSRPPPALTSKKGDSGSFNSKLKTSKSYAFERMRDDRSPPYFDVEIDASSSAAADAAAMKDAVEQAQAKLRSAKELMDRKKEGLQSRSKTRVDNSSVDIKARLIEEDHRSNGFRIESKTRLEVREENQKEKMGIKDVKSSVDGEKNITEAGNSMKRKAMKEHKSYVGLYDAKGTVASREATQPSETVVRKTVKDVGILEPYARSTELKQHKLEVLETFESKEDGRQETRNKSLREEEHVKEPTVVQKACKPRETENTFVITTPSEADENELYENLIEIQLKDNDMVVGVQSTVANEKVVTENRLKKEDEMEGYGMGSDPYDWEDYDIGLQETNEKEHETGVKGTEEQDAKLAQQSGHPEIETIQSEEEKDHERGESVRIVEDPFDWEENEKILLEASEESEKISEMVLEQDQNKKEETLNQKEKVLPEEDTKKTEEAFEQEKACTEDENEQMLNHAGANEKVETIHEMNCNSEENRKVQKDLEGEESKEREEAVSENEHNGAKWEDYEKVNSSEGSESSTGEHSEASDGADQAADDELLQASGDVQHDVHSEKHDETLENPFWVNNGKPRSHGYNEKVGGTDEHGEVRMSDFTISDSLNENGAKTYGVNVTGKTQPEKDKKTCESSCGSEKANSSARNPGVKRTNGWGARPAVDPEGRTNISSSNGRKPLMDQVDSSRNTNNPVPKVASRSMERNNENRNKEKEEKLQREREVENVRLRKLEEERERQIEREKDRMAVDRDTLEARERAFAEKRERSERAAVERATAEFRQRALAEARERLEKACAEARERSLAEKASEGRLRVEKATAEARERAERSVVDKFSASRSGGIRQNSLSSDTPDSQFQKVGSYNGLRYSQTAASSGGGGEGESPQRCKARLERHQRTADRAAKALAEKNMRDLITQKEQAERNRLAEGLDAEVKRWSNGKQGNLRALLSTLQYILGSDSGWQPVPLTEVITTAAVKKAYRKATLCVHPDKLQQRGASIQQKYICEKVFDLLKEAWNKFNSEER